MRDGTNDPVRVGVVVYGPLDSRTGGHLYDRQVAEYLRSRGDAVEVVSIPDRPAGRSIPAVLSPRVSRTLRACDVVLQDEICHASLPVAPRRVAGTPVVAVVHHLRSDEARKSWRNRLLRRFERRYLGSVDGYVFNSRATRSSVERLVDPDPGVLAPPAGDRFASAVGPDEVVTRARTEPFRVASVAGVTPRKGVTSLVEGLSRVSGDWELTIAGETETNPVYVDRVRDLAERRGVADRVTLTGRIPDAEVATLFERSHLFALPSQYEAFGMGYLEGMGFGLPAVASSRGGAREVVEHGENGFLVPPNDPGAVTDAIAPLVYDRRRLARLGRAALETFRAHPTWTDTGARIRRFIRTLAR